MAERDGVPALLIGVRTGGLVVAEAMARAALPRRAWGCRAHTASK